MATDHFCLIWNNFQNSILSALGSLQTCQDLVDVTLMCEGKNVKAHKVILSACSPYFRNLFKEIQCQHPIIILKDVTHSDLTALLQFMYQGEVMVSQDSLSSFLKTAELLQISGLTGSTQEAANLEKNNKKSISPPTVSLEKPPDLEDPLTNKITSNSNFTKQKNVKEPEEINNKTNFMQDAEQSCSYQASSPMFIKTESLDKDYDDMDTEPTNISIPDDNFDSTSSQLDEPSILERSLKANSANQINIIYKRQRRTTKEQARIMVNYVHDHRELLNKTDKKYIESWRELTEILNNSGLGPQKSLDDWRKVLKEVRVNARKHYRAILRSRNLSQSQRKFSNIKPLNDIEKLILEIIGV